MIDGWYCYREGYLTQGDDWITRDSWSGERTLWRSPEDKLFWRASDVGNRSNSLILKIRVVGKRAGQEPFLYYENPTRLRPNRCYPQLRFGNHYDSLTPVPCKSVKDACRKADNHPELEAKIQELLHKAYSPKHAWCVYRKRNGDKTLPHPTAWDHILGAGGPWMPWATFFRAYNNQMEWPYGEYVKIGKDWKGKEHAAYVRHFGTGYSESSGPGEVPDYLEPWIEGVEYLEASPGGDGA